MGFCRWHAQRFLTASVTTYKIFSGIVMIVAYLVQGIKLLIFFFYIHVELIYADIAINLI